MTTETRKRRNYTEEFKRDAVALVTEQGYKPSEAARSPGIRDNLVRRWKREFEEAATSARLGSDEREELKRLRKESCFPCIRTLKIDAPVYPVSRDLPDFPTVVRLYLTSFRYSVRSLIPSMLATLRRWPPCFSSS
jgi:transposase